MNFMIVTDASILRRHISPSLSHESYHPNISDQRHDHRDAQAGEYQRVVNVRPQYPYFFFITQVKKIKRFHSPPKTGRRNQIRLKSSQKSKRPELYRWCQIWAGLPLLPCIIFHWLRLVSYSSSRNRSSSCLRVMGSPQLFSACEKDLSP